MDDIEIGQGGLDHDHVGAFVHIQEDLANGLPEVGRVHLVPPAVAKGGGASGRIPKRPVESGSVFGGVGEQADMLQRIFIERLADGGDTSVHHVGRSDQVRPRLSVAAGGSSQQGERGVVVDLELIGDSGLGPQGTAVAVVRIFTEADIADDGQVGTGVLDGPNGLRHDSGRVPGS